MDEDFINKQLAEVAEEYREDYVEILYNDFLEAMYGTDPRFFGPDWDYYA